MQRSKLVCKRGTIYNINTDVLSNVNHENSLDVGSGQRDSVQVISLELAVLTNK